MASFAALPTYCSSNQSFEGKIVQNRCGASDIGWAGIGTSYPSLTTSALSWSVGACIRHLFACTETGTTGYILLMLEPRQARHQGQMAHGVPQTRRGKQGLESEAIQALRPVLYLGLSGLAFAISLHAPKQGQRLALLPLILIPAFLSLSPDRPR
jgi:hypothetical protein